MRRKIPANFYKNASLSPSPADPNILCSGRAQVLHKLPTGGEAPNGGSSPADHTFEQRPTLSPAAPSVPCFLNAGAAPRTQPPSCAGDECALETPAAEPTSGSTAHACATFLQL